MPNPEKLTHDATREALLSFQPVGRQFIAYSGLTFQWSRAGNRWRLKSGRTVADVVPDERCPGMYRVKLAGEPLSDMVNQGCLSGARARPPPNTREGLSRG